MTRRPARGFSLLELIVASALVGVMAAAAVPSFGHAMARQRLTAASERLAADLAQARFDAVQRQQPLHVAMRAGDDWCWAVASAPLADCRVASPAMLKQVRAADHPGVQLTRALTASFDPAATTVAAGLGATLRNAEGEERRVQLTPLGRASVCTPAITPGANTC
jgi:type IV fimbrial biogenesis protein FimT